MGKFRLTDDEKAWILYDVGNSAFILLASTILPIYYNALAESAGISSVDYLASWGYAVSAATLIGAAAGWFWEVFPIRRATKKDCLPSVWRSEQRHVRRWGWRLPGSGFWGFLWRPVSPILTAWCVMMPCCRILRRKNDWTGFRLRICLGLYWQLHSVCRLPVSLSGL